MDHKVSSETPGSTRGTIDEKADVLKYQSDFLGAQKLYRSMIKNAKNSEERFKALLQYCVCSLMRSPDDLRFFTDLVKKTSDLKVDLSREEKSIANADSPVEYLIILSCAFATRCQESTLLSDDEGEKIMKNLEDYLHKIFCLFGEMLKKIQFRWTICRAFIPLHKIFMTYLNLLKSPSIRTMVKIRCCTNIATFSFLLGDFAQSGQSLRDGIQTLDAQFGTHAMERERLELYEKYATLMQTIKKNGGQDMSLKFGAGLKKNDTVRIRSMWKSMKARLSHEQEYVVKLKKMEGEFQKLLQKGKYRKAYEVSRKLSSESEGDIPRLQLALMQVECELLEEKTFGKNFDEFLALAKELLPTPKLALDFSHEREVAKEIIQSIILLRVGISWNPSDLELTEMSTARLFKIYSSNGLSMGVKAKEIVEKLAETWAADVFEVFREEKNPTVKQVATIGGICHDLAKFFHCSNNHENLLNFSKLGIELAGNGQEIKKYPFYSVLLYYQAVALRNLKKNSDALEIAEKAENSLREAIADGDEKFQGLQKILTSKITKLKKYLEKQRNEPTIKRTASQSTGFMSLTELDGIEIRPSESMLTMSDIAENLGYVTSEIASEADYSTSQSHAAAATGAILAPNLDQGIRSKIEALTAEVENHHSDILNRIIPSFNELIERSSSPELKALCFNKIGQTYMVVGRVEDALANAQQGLSVDQQDFATAIELFILAGDASAQMRNFGEAELYYSRAHNHFKQVSFQEKTDDKRQLIVDKLDSIVAQKRSTKGRGFFVRVTKLIGPEGGKIETDGYTIYFPKGSLKENTLICITLEACSGNIPPNLIPVASRLKLYPKMHLMKPANIKARTWCSTEDLNVKAEIYYRNHSSEDWQWVRATPIGMQREISFQIDYFCQYFVGVPEDSEVDIDVKSWLFVDDIKGILYNQIYVDSKVKENDLVEEMRLYGCRPAYYPVSFVTAKRDVIKITLRPENEQQNEYQVEPEERQVKISTDVLRHLSVNPNKLDFIVKKYMGEKIILKHEVSQAREGRVIRAEPKDVILGPQMQSGFGELNVYGPMKVGSLRV